MKKTLLLLLAVGAVLFSHAQKADGKKVKTKYLSIPCYSIESTDPESIVANFAIGQSTFGTEKLKDMESTCVPKGGSIKDAVKIKTYFYEVAVDRDWSYLTIEEDGGDVLYAAEISQQESTFAFFGKDKCENWIADNMKKEFAKSKSSWENKNHSVYSQQQQAIAEELAKVNMTLTYIDTDFEVFTAKDKNYSYVDLDQAQETALAAYKDISKEGVNSASAAKLREAIDVWTPYVSQIDWEDKDAKINKKIGQGILMNLMNAHRFLFEMDDAIKYGIEADKSFGSFTNNTRLEIQSIIQLANAQASSVELNKTIIEDLGSLNAKAKAASKIKVRVKTLDEGTIMAMRAKFLTYSSNSASDIKGQQLSNFDSGVDNTENPYNIYVQDVAGGLTVSFMKFQKEVESLPLEITQLPLASVIIVGNAMVSIPPEIGNMKELKILNVSNNSISELPEEIGNCEMLEKLYLNGNPITSLPESLSKLTNLKLLSIKNTNISDAELGNISSMLPDCKIKF